MVKPDPDSLGETAASTTATTTTATTTPATAATATATATPTGQQSPAVPPAPSGSIASSKDPGRPRRKKARRACFACQRAHLTCGDERPCQRCIKRGLQNACHDGVRKKAKYLHDAPIDDVSEFPGGFTTYTTHRVPGNINTDMLPPDGTINPGSIQSPGLQESSPTKGSAGGGNTGDGGNGGGTGGSGNGGGRGAGGGNFPGTPLFDPSDPAFFNFDIASLNFGSQYGALEFGVLGRMSGQAADADDGSVGSYAYSPSMGAGEGYGGFSAPQDDPPHYRDSWGGGHGGRNSGAGHSVGFAGTYMIEAGPGSLTSPSPPVESPRQNYIQNTAQTTASSSSYDTTATSGPMSSPSFYQSGGHHRPSTLQQVQSAPTAQQQQQQQVPQVQAPMRRRRLPEDPSQIYSSITTPYPYTLHYHRLFHMLETRFPKPLLLRIARAMASFRPSFIACTQTLKADDLLFMEKCFQRTLWEYERFIQNCGTPTLVCRRTGEVVGVGKEFCMLTGWEKQVLLGEKANRNTNVPVNGEVVNFPPPSVDEYGHGGVGVAASGGGGGVSGGLGGVKKPVFLAELLDDESVVEFYEQFARLAFGDSRGAVMTTCKVLKYRAEKDDSKKDGVREARGMDGLGAKDGKVECAFCWTIKRDVFDIPMLIVANFLPILPRPAPEGGK
ncbi:hypothetical protein HOY82DRAFT_248819 [Tuber indicum]|nr:hypothetical protein HOY82DRAFT_248819 [Tuber indicum]